MITLKNNVLTRKKTQMCMHICVCIHTYTNTYIHTYMHIYLVSILSHRIKSIGVIGQYFCNLYVNVNIKSSSSWMLLLSIYGQHNQICFST